MNTPSTSLTGKGSISDSGKDPTGSRSCSRCGCNVDIHVDGRGDANIYNCSTPSGTGMSQPRPRRAVNFAFLLTAPVFRLFL
jgi:hypothetical protein